MDESEDFSFHENAERTDRSRPRRPPEGAQGALLGAGLLAVGVVSGNTHVTGSGLWAAPSTLAKAQGSGLRGSFVVCVFVGRASGSGPSRTIQKDPDPTFDLPRLC